MPCDDCEAIHGQLSRMRIMMEQNFSALLKRLDQQDRHSFLMMQLISDRSAAVIDSTIEHHGGVAFRKFTGRLRNSHRRPAMPSKRFRFSSTVSSTPSVGNAWPNSNVPEGLVDLYTSTSATQGDDGAERQIYAQNILDTNQVSNSEIDGVHLENHGNEASGMQEDLLAEESSSTDLQQSINYKDRMPNEMHSFEVVPHFIHDGAVEDGFGSNIPEEAFGSLSNAATSGTACVTVRSAIRMEDLDQAGMEISTAGDRRPVIGCGESPEPAENANQQFILKEGQRFESMEDFISCLHQYEQSCGIALIVADSKRVETANKKLKPGTLPWDSKFKYAYFELRCSRAGTATEQCPFRLLVNNSKTERRLVITKLVESHYGVCFTHNHDDTSRMRLLKRLL